MTENEDLVHAVGEAVEASTRKEHAVADAFEALTEANALNRKVIKRGRIVILILGSMLIAGTTYTAIQSHDVNSRSQHNTPVLLCLAASEHQLADDLHRLQSNPHAVVVVPADCKTIDHDR
jgi:hypothetical protein